MAVFVFYGKFHLGQPFFEQLRLVFATAPAAESVAAPAYVNVGQVFFGFPVFGIQHDVDTGSVGAGCVAEDTEGCAAPCVVCRCAAGFQGFALFPDMLADKIVFVGFIQFCRQQHCAVHQFGQMGKGIPEQAADACGHVDAGALQFV